MPTGIAKNLDVTSPLAINITWAELTDHAKMSAN